MNSSSSSSSSSSRKKREKDGGKRNHKGQISRQNAYKKTTTELFCFACVLACDLNNKPQKENTLPCTHKGTAQPARTSSTQKRRIGDSNNKEGATQNEEQKKEEEEKEEEEEEKNRSQKEKKTQPDPHDKARGMASLPNTK